MTLPSDNNYSKESTLLFVIGTIAIIVVFYFIGFLLFPVGVETSIFSMLGFFIVYLKIRKKKKYRKILFKIFVPFVILTIVFGVLFYSITNDDIDSDSIDSVRPLLPIAEYLPNRDDIGTSWKIHEIEDVSYSCDGFIEGVERSYVDSSNQLAFSSPSIISVDVVRFDTANSAISCYEDKLNPVIQEGGYDEVNISIRGAECYGTEKSTDFIYSYTVRCVEDVFYVYVSGVGSSISLSGDIKSFVRDVTDKI